LDYTNQLLGKEELDVDGALITCPVPFHQWSYLRGGREYRGIRTERYTYVKDLNGPWLLYDNETDPYQLKNLCNNEQYTEIQADLETKLQKILLKHDDKFMNGAYYMKVWNYFWDYNDSIKPTK